MKKLLILVLILSLLILSVSCNSDTAGAPQTTSGAAEATKSLETGANAVSNNDYDIMGEIIEIVGNEVTLKLMEFDATETETRVPGSGMGRNSGGVPSEKNYTGEELILIIPVGTLMVTRVPGQSTGTTAASGSGTGTGTGPVENEIGLNELAKGMFLKIRFFDDSQAIEKVLVQKPRT